MLPQASTTVTLKKEMIPQDVKPKRLLLETVELPVSRHSNDRQQQQQQQQQQQHSSQAKHIRTAVFSNDTSPSPLPSPSVSPRWTTPDNSTSVTRISSSVAFVPEVPETTVLAGEMDGEEEDNNGDDAEYEEEEEEEASLGSLHPTHDDDSLLGTLSFASNRTESRATVGQKNRTKYSEKDNRVLNEIFNRMTNPDLLMRQEIGEKLGKTEAQIRTWFARKRIAINKHKEATHAQDERRSSNLPNATRGGSPSSPRQTHGRNGTTVGRASSREASPSAGSSKMQTSSEITRSLGSFLRGQIAREDDVSKVVALMREAGDVGGRRYLLNVVRMSRLVAKQFVQANVTDVLQQWLAESRAMMTDQRINCGTGESPSAENITSPGHLKHIMDVLAALPLEARHVVDTDLSDEIKYIIGHKDTSLSSKAKTLYEGWEEMARGWNRFSRDSDSSSRSFRRQKSSSSGDDDRLFEQDLVHLPSFTKKKPVASDTTPRARATVNHRFFNELGASSTPSTSKSSSSSGKAKPPSPKSSTTVENSHSSNSGKRKAVPDLHVDAQSSNKKAALSTSTSSPSSSPTSARTPVSSQALSTAAASNLSSAPPPVGTLEEAQAMIQQRRLQREKEQREKEQAAAAAAAVPSAASTTTSPTEIKFEVDMGELPPTLSSLPATIPGSILRKAVAAPGETATQKKPKKVVRFEHGDAFLQVREFDKNDPITYKDGDELPSSSDEDAYEDDDDEEGYGGDHWMAPHPNHVQYHYHHSHDTEMSDTAPAHVVPTMSLIHQQHTSFLFGAEAIQLMMSGELYYPPIALTNAEQSSLPCGSQSQEKITQEHREAMTMSASDFDLEHMPDSPEEPEHIEDTRPDPAVPVRPIPLYINDQSENPEAQTALLNQVLAQLQSQNQQQQQQLLQQMQLTALYGGITPTAQHQLAGAGYGGNDSIMDVYGQAWPESTGAAYNNTLFGQQQQQQLGDITAQQLQQQVYAQHQQQPQQRQDLYQDASQRISDLLGMLPSNVLNDGHSSNSYYNS